MSENIDMDTSGLILISFHSKKFQIREFVNWKV